MSWNGRLIQLAREIQNNSKEFILALEFAQNNSFAELILRLRQYSKLADPALASKQKLKDFLSNNCIYQYGEIISCIFARLIESINLANYAIENNEVNPKWSVAEILADEEYSIITKTIQQLFCHSTATIADLFTDLQSIKTTIEDIHNRLEAEEDTEIEEIANRSFDADFSQRLSAEQKVLKELRLNIIENKLKTIIETNAASIKLIEEENIVETLGIYSDFTEQTAHHEEIKEPLRTSLFQINIFGFKPIINPYLHAAETIFNISKLIFEINSISSDFEKFDIYPCVLKIKKLIEDDILDKIQSSYTIVTTWTNQQNALYSRINQDSQQRRKSSISRKSRSIKKIETELFFSINQQQTHVFELLLKEKVHTIAELERTILHKKLYSLKRTVLKLYLNQPSLDDALALDEKLDAFIVAIEMEFINQKKQLLENEFQTNFMVKQEELAAIEQPDELLHFHNNWFNNTLPPEYQEIWNLYRELYQVYINQMTEICSQITTLNAKLKELDADNEQIRYCSHRFYNEQLVPSTTGQPQKETKNSNSSFFTRPTRNPTVRDVCKQVQEIVQIGNCQIDANLNFIEPIIKMLKKADHAFAQQKTKIEDLRLIAAIEYAKTDSSLYKSTSAPAVVETVPTNVVVLTT